MSFPARVEYLIDPLEVVVQVHPEADFSRCFEELPFRPVTASSRVLPENCDPLRSNHALTADLIRSGDSQRWGPWS